MKRITPFLWFDGDAERAARFYVSIFKSSKITSIERWGDVGPGKKGSVMSVMFTLDGQDFMALNGGPHFKFTPAVSMYVNCKTQKEIDQYWKKLSRGGKTEMCGWLRDRYGLSWQIVPDSIQKFLHGKDATKSNRAMKAMLGMTKLDLRKLQKAYDGK